MTYPSVSALDRIKTDIDQAACVAYRTFHLESAVPFEPWNDLSDRQRQPWRAAVTASWAVLDPERYGQFAEITRQAWAHLRVLFNAYGPVLSMLADSAATDQRRARRYHVDQVSPGKHPDSGQV